MCRISSTYNDIHNYNPALYRTGTGPNILQLSHCTTDKRFIIYKSVSWADFNTWMKVIMELVSITRACLSWGSKVSHPEDRGWRQISRESVVCQQYVFSFLRLFYLIIGMEQRVVEACAMNLINALLLSFYVKQGLRLRRLCELVNDIIAIHN